MTIPPSGKRMRIAMGNKKTYEELVERVRALEFEATELRKTEEKLKESENRLKVQYKHIPIPTYTWQKSGEDLVLSDFNDAAAEITKGRIMDYMGIKAAEMYQQSPEILGELTRCISGKTVSEVETCYRFISTGEEKILNVKYAFVPPDSVIVHTEDITARVEAERKLRESYDLLERRVKERTAELAETVDRLKEEILHREEAEKALRESQERFRGLVQDMPCLLCRFLPDGTLTFVNERYCSYFSRKREDLIGQNFFQFIPEQDREKVREKYLSLTRENPIITYEHQVVAPDGSARWQEWADRVIVNQEGQAEEYQSIGLDITERKQVEEELKERTKKLEQLNAALKVILDKRDQDIKYLEDKVLGNMKQLVMPFLEKLQACGLNERQQTYLEIVQSNLKEIVSPFVRRLSEIHMGLTPTEIQVANLVKEGKTTKEIAALMGSSVRAVEFHRESLRKKLGLKDQKVNLRSYLLSAS